MTYFDTILAKYPPGTAKVFGDCPRPRSSATNGTNPKPEQEVPGMGHNSENAAPMVDADDAAKAAILAEIRAGLLSRLGPAFEFMSAEEIGAAQNRGVLLKRAHTDGLAYLHRALDVLHPDHEGKRRGTSVVFSVFSFECLFSDNPSGCSTASNKRLAALIGVGERVVRYARNLLVEMKATVCRAIPGIGNAYYPVFNRKLTGATIQLTDWLDATSEPTRHGRHPGKPRHTTVRGLGPETPALSVPRFEETPAPSVPRFEKTPAPFRKTPAPVLTQPIENKGNAGRESTKESTKKEKDGADAPGAYATPNGEVVPNPKAGTGSTQASNAAATAASVAFDEFWAAFPPGRKRNKGDTRDLFTAIVTGKHKKRRASAETIIAAAKRYAATKPDPQYTPMPMTWLNGGRWEDDDCQLPARRQDEEAELAATLARMRAEEGWQ